MSRNSGGILRNNYCTVPHGTVQKQMEVKKNEKAVSADGGTKDAL